MWILDKAKPTGSLLVPVQSHDNSLDLAALREKRVNLLFGCVKGKIADIKGAGLFNATDKRIRTTLFKASKKLQALLVLYFELTVNIC